MLHVLAPALTPAHAAFAHATETRVPCSAILTRRRRHHATSSWRRGGGGPGGVSGLMGNEADSLEVNDVLGHDSPLQGCNGRGTIWANE